MSNIFANWTDADILAHQSRIKHKQVIASCQAPTPEVKKAVQGRTGANKTENAYSVMLGYEFPGCKIVFEGLNIKLDAGHGYKPDWVVRLPDGGILCVEVKARGSNGFRQPSYQRARLAFDCARNEWPMWRWRWAEWHNRQWDIKEYTEVPNG